MRVRGKDPVIDVMGDSTPLQNDTTGKFILVQRRHEGRRCSEIYRHFDDGHRLEREFKRLSGTSTY